MNTCKLDSWKQELIDIISKLKEESAPIEDIIQFGLYEDDVGYKKKYDDFEFLFEQLPVQEVCKYILSTRNKPTVEVLEYFVSKGFDLEKEGNYLWSPGGGAFVESSLIMGSIYACNYEVTKYLLEKGMRPEKFWVDYVCQGYEPGCVETPTSLENRLRIAELVMKYVDKAEMSDDCYIIVPDSKFFGKVLLEGLRILGVTMPKKIRIALQT